MIKASLNQVKIGDSVDRVEGRVKVTGAAKYAAEYDLPGVTYGVLVTSTIAKGRIRNLDTSAAEKAPGVLAIVSHLNSPKVAGYEGQVDNEGSRVYGQEFRLFYDDKIYHNHQPIALAIADTLERADYAASLVQVQYDKEEHQTNLAQHLNKGIKPKREDDYARGIPDAYKNAPVKIEQEYKTPFQVHNPMEMHATTAHWEAADKITIYNKTQAVKLTQKDIMKAFNLAQEQVLVHSPFVGGAFGSSSRVWPPEMAAILGAKKVGRPVKVVAKRDQVFNMVGYRPRSIQKIGLGATPDGKLTGITHEAFGDTSTYEQFTERLVHPTKSLYHCPDLNTVYQLVPLDLSTPCWTRGPGETSGSFALESAMDELAYALKMDPLALRLKNYAAVDPENNKPWSSNYLRACYEQGAKQFGWHKRQSTPRAMQEGEWLIGMGMAAGIYKSGRDKAAASAKLQADGTVLVQTSVADVGPGSATIMTQIAAETLGLDMQKVKFEWGNSSFPLAPGQFGSHTTASVGSAVYDVCTALKLKLIELAQAKPNPDLSSITASNLIFEDGALKSSNKSVQIAYTDVLKNNNLPELQVTKESESGPEQKNYSSKSFCANFVEVRVHAATGEVRVNRVVSVVDAGKIINHKTAESQVYGSVVWGIGLALMEEAVLDDRFGRHVNNDLANYHVPIHADIPDIKVVFIDQVDPVIDPMGAKGIGEIPLIGFTAAIANAVYNATGKRIRELPITPDKLI